MHRVIPKGFVHASQRRDTEELILRLSTGADSERYSPSASCTRVLCGSSHGCSRG